MLVEIDASLAHCVRLLDQRDDEFFCDALGQLSF
jgi:hypothetical protein